MVVAEELHFGRAAARLYITQPGLSQAIARMERQLDVQLLRRTRSSVELTEAGAELLRCGRRLLADLDGAVTRVRMAGRGEAGLVRIGVAHLAEPLVAPALAAFQADHPSIVVDRYTARTIRADGIVVVPLEPPPQYLLALAWRHDEQSAVAHRCLDYLRSYRDRHAWISEPDMSPLTQDHGPGLVAGGSWKNSRLALSETTSSSEHHRKRTRSAHP